MCKPLLTTAQILYNIDFKCCPYSKERITRDRQTYTKKTGKPSFYYHCCKCKRSKRLVNLEPIDDTYLNLWCEKCSKDNNTDDEYVIVKEEVQTIESTSSKSSFYEENNNLISFGLDEESIKKFCIDYFSINNSYHNKDLREQLINNRQEFDKVIKDKDSIIKNCRNEIKDLKEEIKTLEKEQSEAYSYYKKENDSYWDRIQKLQSELNTYKYEKNKKRKFEVENVQQSKRRNSI